MAAFLTTGFQATHLGRAIEEVKKMLRWRGQKDGEEVRWVGRVSSGTVFL